MEHINVIVDEGLRTGMGDVADPGASGTIEFENKGLIAICKVVTAAAESRTLEAAANHPVGSRLTVILQTDGGDLTINSDDTAVVLDNAGDRAEFEVVDDSGTHEWRRVSSTTLFDELDAAESAATVIPDAQQEEIAAGNPGAISVATFLTRIGADAGGDAFTLADGTSVGQLKKITMDDATGTGTVTLTSPADENTLTFDAVGETALLRWNGTGWRIVSAYNEASGADGPGLSTV